MSPDLHKSSLNKGIIFPPKKALGKREHIKLIFYADRQLTVHNKNFMAQEYAVSIRDKS
jgi:hypothetical protein